jgi:hypothetical protein
MSTRLATPSIRRREVRMDIGYLGPIIGLDSGRSCLLIVPGDSGMTSHLADDYSAAFLVKLRYGACSIRSFRRSYVQIKREGITTLTAVHLFQ